MSGKSIYPSGCLNLSVPIFGIKLCESFLTVKEIESLSDCEFLWILAGVEYSIDINCIISLMIDYFIVA